MRLGRRSLTVLVAGGVWAGLVFGAAAPAAADDGGHGPHDNIVYVRSRPGQQANRQWGSAVVSFDDNGTVDNRNYAYATSSCTGCRTVAAAVQVIVAEGAVSDDQPVNEAVAYNDQCSGCQTLAYARQFVIQEPGRVELDGHGEQQVRAIDIPVGEFRRIR